MLRQIDGMGLERLSADELAPAKACLLGRFALNRRTNARLAWHQAFLESAGVSLAFAERYVRAVEAVSAEDAQRVAGVYLAAPTNVRLEPPPSM
jgi:predicted Zn-dependent peptidase